MAVDMYRGSSGIELPPEVSQEIWQNIQDASVVMNLARRVNLSGAGLADHRWTDHYRRVLRASRVDSTRTITQAVAEADPKPRVLLNASAIGWYGDTGEHAVTEEAGPGSGFLAELCREWEAAAEPADRAGLRVDAPLGQVLPELARRVLGRGADQDPDPDYRPTPPSARPAAG